MNGDKRDFLTDQETFWAGTFGTEYIKRNQSDDMLASNLNFFSKSLRSACSVKSCIEFGANIGMNLKALQLLYPSQEQHGIEINADAANQLGHVIPPARVYNISVFDFQPRRSWDLVLSKGFLIHINPDRLPQVYDKMVTASARYLLVAEYYNPTPVSILYRGNKDRLFKRDFAGEIMDRYPNVQLLEYGFVYKRDASFPQDDVTWFLLEKRNTSS
jgi:spore coat polysaccharide biosynthesis protein SpsF